MENKYFTPDIEEMFVGCEFEMHDTRFELILIFLPIEI